MAGIEREMNVIYAELEEAEQYWVSDLKHDLEYRRKKQDNIYLTIITLGEVTGYRFEDYVKNKEEQE